MKIPTIAKVTFWDEIDEKMKTETLFLYTQNSHDAIDQICDWYGEESLDTFTIKFYEEGLVKVDCNFINEYLVNDNGD